MCTAALAVRWTRRMPARRGRMRRRRQMPRRSPETAWPCAGPLRRTTSTPGWCAWRIRWTTHCNACAARSARRTRVPARRSRGTRPVTRRRPPLRHRAVAAPGPAAAGAAPGRRQARAAGGGGRDRRSVGLAWTEPRDARFRGCRRGRTRRRRCPDDRTPVDGVRVNRDVQGACRRRRRGAACVNLSHPGPPGEATLNMGPE